MNTNFIHNDFQFMIHETTIENVLQHVNGLDKRKFVTFLAIDLFYGDIFVSFEGHEIHEVLEKRSLTPKIRK